MRARTAIQSAASAVTLCAPIGALADNIPVAPGPDTLAAAASAARSGDVLVLELGEYHGPVRVPAGVSIRGAGADQTIIHAGERGSIECSGPEVTISGVELRGDFGDLRAIGTMHSVRVERCRIVGYQQGVALSQAPLSDVVHCEFIDCGIAVRAIGEACPTVWGCLISGGQIGVFAMDGAPYVRNNVFNGVETGILLITELQPIVRNNVLLDCTKEGIRIQPPERSVFSASIRNNIFDGCPAAISGPGEALSMTSHNVVHGAGDPAFRDAAGAEVADPAATSREDPALTLDKGEVACGNAAILEGRGLRLSSEEEDAVGDIGLTRDCAIVGVARPAEAPPIRFRREAAIANAVREEYQALAMWRTGGSQALMQGPGGPRDVFRSPQGEVSFDISRFFAEWSLD